MSCQLILGPSFPVLLDELLDQMASPCRDQPLSPRWVVVPTSTLANHLREEFSRQALDRPLPALRVIPILGFIRRLCSCRPDFQGNRRWSPSLDLSLFELVEQLPATSLLAGLKRIAGGFQFLKPTFLDLADGGFGPDQLEILEALSHEGGLIGPEQEVLDLYRRWIRRVLDWGIPWEPLLHQQLPEWILEEEETTLSSWLGGEADQRPVVALYGFYGFTDVNAQFVAALGRKVDLRLFYPGWVEDGRLHPAFYFTQPLLEDLRVRIGTAMEATVQLAAPEPGHPARFFLSTFPEGPIGAPQEFLTFQQASGIRAEVVSAALKIREWLDHAESPLAPERILLVAPDPAPYLDCLRETFAAFAIPYRLADVPAIATPERSALRMLARIWDSRASAEWVLAYFRDHPKIPLLAGIDLNAFESKVRRLGIWGDDGWSAALERSPAPGGPEEARLPSFTPQETALIQEIVGQWLQEDPAGLLPGPASAFVKRLQVSWVEDPACLAPVVEALRLAEKAAPRLRVGEVLLGQLLRWGEESVQDESMNTHGVLVLSAMRARGFSADGMVLLGLSSGSWPARIQEDPLLSDVSRLRLMAGAREVGHLLPIKSHITEEMTLLFHLLNSSARQLHWVVPETDESGRAVAPTLWVQRYLQHWTEDAPGAGGRIPRGPGQQALALIDLDPERGTRLPPHLLLLLEPGCASHFQDEIPYGYLLEGLEKRERDSHWNGHVPEAALPRPGQASESVHVTQLEQLAKCPFRFFAEAVCSWTALEPLDLTDEVNAMDWGSLVHGFLERLLREGADRRETLGATARFLLESQGTRLRESLREFAEGSHSRLHMLPQPFREATLARLLERVRSYLEQLCGEAEAGAVPVELELRRTGPFPGLPGLTISGQMDRVDRMEEVLHITDYKSGSSPGSSKLKREILLGHRMQATLYPWLFSRESGSADSPAFSYLFLGQVPARKETAENIPEVVEFLEPLAAILKSGLYLPTPTESLELHGVDAASPCRYCEYTPVCRKLDPGAPERLHRISGEKIEARIHAMREAVQTRRTS